MQGDGVLSRTGMVGWAPETERMCVAKVLLQDRAGTPARSLGVAAQLRDLDPTRAPFPRARRCAPHLSPVPLSRGTAERERRRRSLAMQGERGLESYGHRWLGFKDT